MPEFIRVLILGHLLTGCKINRNSSRWIGLSG